MKTFTYKDAKKKGLEEFEFELFSGIKMIAYYENTSLEKGNRITPDYGGFVSIYHIVRKEDDKIFADNIITRHEGIDNFVLLLEEEIGENYGY